jgi:hypothetical protein
MLVMTELHEQLRVQLINFIREIESECWFGKERELLNRFVFNNLAKIIKDGSPFFCLAQIGMEVRVKQAIEGGKKEVCKDLVIWKQPNQTVWTEDNVPLYIIEWKHRNKVPYTEDINWLKKYTEINPGCVGVALNIETEPVYKLDAVLIKKGDIFNQKWIHYPTE